MVLSFHKVFPIRSAAALLDTSRNAPDASRIGQCRSNSTSGKSILKFAKPTNINNFPHFVCTSGSKSPLHSFGYTNFEPGTSPPLKMADDGKETIDLTGDSDSTLSATSEDGDLRRAIAMSLHSIPTSPPGDSNAYTESGAGDGKGEVETAPGAAAGGILGLDRKGQEEERLARLKRKREQSISPPLIKRDVKPVSHLNDTTSLHGKASEVKAPKVSPAELSTSQSTLASGLQYPEGVVKKTWACGFERVNDIKIEEVLQPSNLEAAVLSSFQWDWDWLLPKLHTRKSKFVFVLQAKDDKTKKLYHSDFGGVPNVRLCFPSMEGQVNCMHSKLMLLFYPTHMRLVVPTANLTPYDWGEPFRGLQGGIMENTVFLVDLPKRDTGTDENENAEIPFLQSLLYFLKAMKMQEDVTKKLQIYDFSKLAQYGFVHSIGGSHYGDAWRETGACGLGQFLHKVGLRTFDSVEIDYVTSSIGSLDDEFLRSLYLVAQGDSGLAEYTLRTAKGIPPSVLQDLNRRVGKDFSSGWKQRFRFYYPSDDTVKNSKGGRGNGGTICFHPRWWDGLNFPRGLMRDCQSMREGMLMHNKVSQARSHANS
jgi:Tyrosyl-DNA phosphodiesterase